MAVDFRYRRVGYVGLNVTDLDKTSAFATEVFGLDPAGEGPSGERFFRAGGEHHSVVLHQAAEPAFIRAGWELETEEDVAKALRHFTDLGLKPRELAQDEAAALGVDLGPAFRVREPVNGLCFEYYARMKTLTRPRTVRLTEFRRFAHVGIATPKVRESTECLLEHFGFLASDIVGNYMTCFMRPFPVPDHHGFGYLPTRAGVPEFNHLAFLVESIDDIGKLFNRIEARDVPRAFGIGRHPTSGSIHLYINDPDGMLWEYTLGMEQFPETGAREARYMSAAPEDSDLWGARMRPSFRNGGGVITSDDGSAVAPSED